MKDMYKYMFDLSSVLMVDFSENITYNSIKSGATAARIAFLTRNILEFSIVIT